MYDRFQLVEFGRCQRVIEIKRAPRRPPRTRVGFGVRRIALAHDRHDDHGLGLRLDKRNALALQRRANGIRLERKIEAGDIFGRRVALGTHRKAGNQVSRLDVGEARDLLVGRDWHDAFEQGAERRLLAVGHRLVFGRNGIFVAGLDRIVGDSECGVGARGESLICARNRSATHKGQGNRRLPIRLHRLSPDNRPAGGTSPGADIAAPTFSCYDPQDALAMGQK